MFTAHRKQRGIATSENPLTLDLLTTPDRSFNTPCHAEEATNQGTLDKFKDRKQVGTGKPVGKNHHPNVPNLKIRRPHLHYEFEKKLKKRKKRKIEKKEE